MRDAFALLKSGPPYVTIDTLCKLHKTMMRRSRVLYVNKGYEKRLAYVNIGVTRQVTASNVSVTVRATGMKVQFCPWDEVTAELTVFCDRMNVSFTHVVKNTMCSAYIWHFRRCYSKMIWIRLQ